MVQNSQHRNGYMVKTSLLPPSLPPSSLIRSQLCYQLLIRLFRNILCVYKQIQGFPHSLVGKESACNEGDPRLILGSGRSAGEGIGYPLQYFWASLVAQLIKNPPAM